MEDFTQDIASLDLKDDEKPVIKVALLDDGVDHKREDIEVVKGETFCEIPGEKNSRTRFRDYWVNPGKHGTVMASFIRQICPVVELHVARLDDSGLQRGGGKFTVRSAIDVSFESVPGSPVSYLLT